jgi:hypothetical protein
MRRFNDVTPTEQLEIRGKLTQIMVTHDLSLETMAKIMADTVSYFLRKIEEAKE